MTVSDGKHLFGMDLLICVVGLVCYKGRNLLQFSYHGDKILENNDKSSVNGGATK